VTTRIHTKIAKTIAAAAMIAAVVAPGKPVKGHSDNDSALAGQLPRAGLYRLRPEGTAARANPGGWTLPRHP